MSKKPAKEKGEEHDLTGGGNAVPEGGLKSAARD